MGYVDENSVKLRKKIDTGVDHGRLPRTFIPDTPGRSIKELEDKRKKVSTEIGPSPESLQVVKKTTRPNPVVLSKVIKLPRHLYIPENAYYFDQMIGALVPIGSVKTSLGSYTVPSGMEGYLKWFGQDVPFAADWFDTTWYIEINGNPFMPYGPLRYQYGGMLDYQMTQVLKYINEGDIIRISASNSGVAPISTHARIKGWIYPKVFNENNNFSWRFKVTENPEVIPPPVPQSKEENIHLVTEGEEQIL